MGKIVGFRRLSGGMWKVIHGNYYLAKAALEYWWENGSDRLVHRVPASRTHKIVDLALRVSDIEALERWQSEKERSK